MFVSSIFLVNYFLLPVVRNFMFFGNEIHTKLTIDKREQLFIIVELSISQVFSQLFDLKIVRNLSTLA